MKIFKQIVGFIVALFLISTLVLTWNYRQNLHDWWQLRDYTPPQSVVLLADKTTMTQKARNIFYINKPEISSASKFNAECSKETSIVLGCYSSHNGIFLYDVEDPRLAGVKEVTAAHEMLHAAYDRLSIDERKRVDAMTSVSFAKLDNERIKANVEKYRQQDPKVVPSELHSILATEVKNLPADLESYYKQYFKNRLAIVGFSDQYESVFTTRQNQVEDYDKQLSQLKIEIDANQNDLTVQYNALASEKRRLDSLLNSSNSVEYNQSVPAFNAQIDQYNVSVREADKKINNYNTLVAKRNSIAMEVQDLARAIDSRPQSF